MNHLSMVFGEEPTVAEPAKANQIVNSTGGYVFATGIWMHLSRFLIIGTEGGTYYASEKKITKDNANNVLACIKTDGRRTVDEIVAISVAGRAPKNDYAIFALAMAGSFGDIETKRYAFSKLNDVCRIGTHLFMFVEFIDGMRGWGRLLTESVANWYLSKNASQVAYQAVKYQSRSVEGRPSWSHNDVLRKCHAKADESSEMQQVFRWITEGWSVTKAGSATIPYVINHMDIAERKTKVKAIRGTYEYVIPNSLRIIEGYELAKHETNPKKLANLITDYNLTHEMIPTEGKNHAVVWEALLEKMPMTAMIRNLGNMSKAGILGPNSQGERKVRENLLSTEQLAKARIHPINVLSAMKIYSQGHGMKGSNTWTVNGQISAALEKCFYLSFGFIEPSNKRFMIGQDVSASMTWSGSNSLGLMASEIATVMSMVTVKTEPYLYHGAFSSQFIETGINSSMDLKQVTDIIKRISFGYTNCAAPIQKALDSKIPVDCFVIYTDNEVNYGKHPFRTLQEYRQKMGINAKIVVAGTTSTGFTLADPNDAGSLDVVGFDSSCPAVISSFAKQ